MEARTPTTGPNQIAMSMTDALPVIANDPIMNSKLRSRSWSLRPDERNEGMPVKPVCTKYAARVAQ